MEKAEYVSIAAAKLKEIAIAASEHNKAAEAHRLAQDVLFALCREMGTIEINAAKDGIPMKDLRAAAEAANGTEN